MDYFADLFTKEDDTVPIYSVKGNFSSLTPDEVLNLDKAIMGEEVKQAVF